MEWLCVNRLNYWCKIRKELHPTVVSTLGKTKLGSTVRSHRPFCFFCLTFKRKSKVFRYTRSNSLVLIHSKNCNHKSRFLIRKSRFWVWVCAFTVPKQIHSTSCSVGAVTLWCSARAEQMKSCIASAPTPWLTWIHFKQISRLFKRFWFPFLT